MDKTGKKKCTAGKDMKGTQSYSYGLASFMAMNFQESRKQAEKAPELIDSSMSCSSSDDDSDDDMFNDVKEILGSE